jgi:hypothetical protein
MELNSRALPLRYSLWSSVWPATLALLGGFFIFQSLPGQLAGNPMLTIWALLAGMLLAVCTVSTLGLASDLKVLRGPLPTGSWLKIVFPQVLAVVLLALVIYALRLIALTRHEDLPLPWREARIAITYFAGLVAVVFAATSLRLILLDLGGVLARIVEPRAPLDELLEKMIVLRRIIYHVFVAFGFIVGTSTLASVAYLSLLASFQDLDLTAWSAFGWGSLVAIGLAAFLAPCQLGYARTSRAVVEAAFPVPSDPNLWAIWAESRASLASILGLGLTPSGVLSN